MWSSYWVRDFGAIIFSLAWAGRACDPALAMHDMADEILDAVSGVGW